MGMRLCCRIASSVSRAAPALYLQFLNRMCLKEQHLRCMIESPGLRQFSKIDTFFPPVSDKYIFKTILFFFLQLIYLSVANTFL